MTAPRQYVPGRTYKITRRCDGRRFYLIPHAEAVIAWRSILANAARRTGVLLHVGQIMSNHYHLIVTDMEGRLGEFMGEVHSQIARFVNNQLGRSGHFWDAGRPAVQWIADSSCLVQQFVYVMANPVAAGIVETADEWPGLLAGVDDIGIEDVAQRSTVGIFANNRRKHASECELVWHAPPGYEADDFRERVRLALGNRERELEEGRDRDVIGVEAALAVDPYYAPNTADDDGGPLEEVIAADTELRIAAISALHQFRQEYARCRRAFCHDRRTVFPSARTRSGAGLE